MTATDLAELAWESWAQNEGVAFAKLPQMARESHITHAAAALAGSAAVTPFDAQLEATLKQVAQNSVVSGPDTLSEIAARLRAIQRLGQRRRHSRD